MRARWVLEKLFRSIQNKGPATKPSSLNPKFYGLLSAKNPQVALAAAEVMHCLADGTFSRAAAICDQMLLVHPGHLLFEGLRLEAEYRAGQSRFDDIKRLREELENDKDLNSRVARLQEAMDLYPDESQIVHLLMNTTAMRDLIDSLLAEARAAESCGNYTEALEKLYTIQECHASLPRLTLQIQRLESAVERNSKTERRSQLIQDVNRLLSARQYERALAESTVALQEFPEDAGLQALQKTAVERKEWAIEVEKLIQRGLELLRKHQIEPALSVFRSAEKFDPNNLQASKLIGIALIDKARAIMAQDPLTGNLLIEEARKLVPTHPDLKLLHSEVGKNSEDAGEGLREMSGNDANRQQPTEAKPNVAANLVSIERARWNALIQGLYRSWANIRESAKTITTNLFMAVPRLQARASHLFNGFGSSYANAVLALFLLTAFAITGLLYVRRHSGTQRVVLPIPVATPLQVSTVPEGADIVVEGHASAHSLLLTKLLPGKYRVSVKMAGYKSQTLPLTVDSVPVNLKVALRPVPLDLHVVSNQSAGRVWVDNEPKGDVNPFGIDISGISPGQHQLRLRGPRGEVVTKFDFQPGRLPSAVDLPKHQPTVLFIGTSDKQSHVECNCGEAILTVDDMTRPLRSGSLDLAISEGEHLAELSVARGEKFSLETGRGPVATVGFFWGKQVSATPSSVDAVLREANAMIQDRNYRAALIKVDQAMANNPSDDRIPILQKRLQRLMVIDR